MPSIDFSYSGDFQETILSGIKTREKRKMAV